MKELKAFKKGFLNATVIQKQNNSKVAVSTLFEEVAYDNEHEKGLNIADYIISELSSKKVTFEIQRIFSQTLQSMIEKNKALLVL